MKRLWISLAILLTLLSGCLFNIFYVTHISNQLVTTLNQAEAWAEQGDWSASERLTRQAQQYWEHASPYLYVTQCHTTTDEINTEFREVLELMEQEAPPEYSAANGVLISDVEHLAGMESFTLENLL